MRDAIKRLGRIARVAITEAESITEPLERLVRAEAECRRVGELLAHAMGQRDAFRDELHEAHRRRFDNAITSAKMADRIAALESENRALVQERENAIELGTQLDHTIDVVYSLGWQAIVQRDWARVCHESLAQALAESKGRERCGDDQPCAKCGERILHVDLAVPAFVHVDCPAPTEPPPTALDDAAVEELCACCLGPVGNSRWRIGLWPRKKGTVPLCVACGTSEKLASDEIRERIAAREVSP